jgi:bifunctional DNA-binding transcriptional regulator/antitoxin component of YhaV-PrlF toxin-antitoxin module
MFFTIVSPKYQATLGVETRRQLGIKPGVRMKGTVEAGRIVLEPIADIMTAYGVFKDYAKHPLPSIQEETEAAERSIAEEAMKSMRDE